LSQFSPRDADYAVARCMYVRASVNTRGILSKRLNISSNFLRQSHHSSFSVSNGIAILRREPPSLGRRMQDEDIAIFDQYLALSRKWYNKES